MRTNETKGSTFNTTHTCPSLSQVFLPIITVKMVEQPKASTPQQLLAALAQDHQGKKDQHIRLLSSPEVMVSSLLTTAAAQQEQEMLAQQQAPQMAAVEQKREQAAMQMAQQEQTLGK